jgi:hypothetical protein
MKRLFSPVFKRKSKRSVIIIVGLVIVLLILVLIFFVRQAQGATVTWNGGGTDGTCGGAGTANNWSCGSNWSTGVAPTSADIATFNATSTKDATIDSAVDVAGISITSAYTGTFTVSASVTVRGSSFAQAGGTWNGGSQTFIVNTNGNFTVSGGVHNATTGTFQVERNFTYSGGTLSMTGATLTLTSDNYQDNTTITCTGALGGSVDITKSDTASSFATTTTIASGCSVTFVSSVVFDGNLTNNGTINATDISLTHDFTQSGTFNLSNTLTFFSNRYSDNSTLTCSGTIPGTVNITKDDSTSGFKPTFTLSANCIINLVSDVVTYGNITNNGTIHGTNITLDQNFTQSGVLDITGILTFNSTSYLDSSVITCTGPLGAVVNITKNNETSGFTPTVTISTNCNVTLADNVSFVGSITNHGTLNIANLTLNQNFSSDGTVNNNGTLTFTATFWEDDSTLTCNQPIEGTVNLTKNGAVAGQFSDFTLSSGCEITLDPNISMVGGITNNGTLNATNITTQANFYQNGTLNMLGTLTISGGGNTAHHLGCSTGTLSTKTIDYVNNVTNQFATTTFDNSCIISGDFIRTDGTISNPASPITFTVLGNFSMSGIRAFGGANLTLAFTGTRNQTLTQNASTVSSPVTINKPSGGDVTLLTNFQINSTGQNLTLTAGTLKNSTFALTINNIFTINGSFVQSAGNVSADTYAIGKTGAWNNISSGDIVVGAGGVTNSGIITLDGTPSTCGDADGIAITSSSNGAQRAWSGSGDFTMTDVTVQDQGGSAYIPVYSGVNVSGNGTNFAFFNSCPPSTIPSSSLRSGTTIQGGTNIQ